VLGIQAEFKPINDIIVGNKKISGNAQTRRFGGVFQHGTLLCIVNPSLMFSLLKVPNEKIRDKLIEAVEERVTSIEKEKGKLPNETVINAMIKGFEKALDIKLVKGELTEEELAMLGNIKQERYENNEWNYKR
jgi:lipoate---protein ligase